MIFGRQSQRSFFGSTVGPIKNLRPLYLAKLSILPTGACFQQEFRKYLSTIINFPFFSQKWFSLLNSFDIFFAIFRRFFGWESKLRQTAASYWKGFWKSICLWSEETLALCCYYEYYTHCKRWGRDYCLQSNFLQEKFKWKDLLQSNIRPMGHFWTSSYHS